jgi:hypothetical protein
MYTHKHRQSNMYTAYAWIVVMGALGAFGFGWGTGANDVVSCVCVGGICI